MLRFDQRQERRNHTTPLSDRLLRSVYLPEPAVRGWSLADLFSTAHIRYVALGRMAFAEALRIAGIASGDSVLVPALICREVLFWLDVVGARPVWYPVDPAFRLAVDPDDLPKARAVIAVNYFGFPQALEPFRFYCRRHDSVLIEDNAHGLFSRDAQGARLGTRGDLGILSLWKTLPIPNGGALVIPRAGRFAAPAQEAFEDGVGMTWRTHLKDRLRRTAVRWGPTSLRLYCQATRVARMGSRRGWPSQHEPHNGTSLPKPCAVLAGPLTVVDPGTESERRGALFRAVHSLVTACGGTPAFQELPDDVVPWGYPFFADGHALQRVRWRLRRERLDCFQWPDELPAAVEPEAPTHYTTLWRVPFLWSKGG